MTVQETQKFLHQEKMSKEETKRIWSRTRPSWSKISTQGPTRKLNLRAKEGSPGQGHNHARREKNPGPLHTRTRTQYSRSRKGGPKDALDPLKPRRRVQDEPGVPKFQLS